MKSRSLTKLVSVAVIILAAGLWLIMGLGAVTAQEPTEDDISAQAVVGTTFTYQGRLTDGGNPANGTYDFEFRLYDALTGGNIITPTVGGVVARNDVPVANGLFTVNLDFGNAFDGKAAWLQIGVRPGASTGGYTILSPRQPLNAVPYALYALQTHQAQSLRSPDGSPSYAVYVDNEGDVGVGTTSPEVPLEIRKSTPSFTYDIIKFGDSAGHAYLGAGSGSFGLADHNKNMRLSILQSNGNVGIGTTNPRDKLEVNGGVRLAVDANACAGSPVNCFGNFQATGAGGLIINSHTGGTWADMHLQTNGTSRMFIESGGNVGVATIDPRATLDVNGGLRLSVNANDCAGSSVNCFGYIQGTGPNGLIINSHTGGTWADMHLQTNGISRLFIESGGNVGVGTTDPRSTLDVNGQTTTRVLQITGGADLAEQFDVKSPETDLPPVAGAVVCIDAEHPGKLLVCQEAYDRTVAGIISGAGGVKPGMVMSQENSMADGQYPIALTGRVYVQADASVGPIQPGDLLTTSAIPGYAMKVTNYEQAQGAILGKAMSSLEEGQGLVLVLVSLQ